MLVIVSKDEYSRKKGGDTIANTSTVCARVDINLKDNVESTPSQPGISPSSAIQMFYSQIVLKGSILFELKLLSFKPLVVDTVTRGQLDAELQKGAGPIEVGKTYSTDGIDAAFTKESGI